MVKIIFKLEIKLFDLISTVPSKARITVFITTQKRIN